MANESELPDAVKELVRAADHVVAEFRLVREAKSSARFRRAIGGLRIAVNKVKQM